MSICREFLANGIHLYAEFLQETQVLPVQRTGKTSTCLTATDIMAQFEKIVKRKERRKTMLLVNTDYITGRKLETIGLVRGSTIQSKHFGKDILQGLKFLIGGELKAYTEMMNDARAVATARMVAEAASLGADGIVNIRYASASVMQSAAEVIAYGTAVKFIED